VSVPSGMRATPDVPAHECDAVTSLLIELARAHGISEATERTNHGRSPTPPAQGKTATSPQTSPA